MEQVKELVENSITTAPKKLLKSASCIYIPCADPDRTMDWYRDQFQLYGNDGPWLTLENGTDLMFCETKDETRMKYKVGEDPNFYMPILMFQVEDIEKLRSSLKQSGAADWSFTFMIQKGTNMLHGKCKPWLLDNRIGLSLVTVILKETLVHSCRKYLQILAAHQKKSTSSMQKK